MKTVTILQNVSIPGMPSFKKGQEVRVSDKIADLLTSRKHAREMTGKTRGEVEASRAKKKSGVTVQKRSRSGKVETLSTSQSSDSSN